MQGAEFVEIKPISSGKNKSYTMADRQHHCQAWRHSGLSMNEYCRQSGLLISTFSQWVKKFKGQEMIDDKVSRGLHADPIEPVIIEIILANGIQLKCGRHTPISEIVRLIKALQSCN